MPTISVTVASDIRRDGIFAEIAVDGALWGEMSLDPTSGSCTLTLFPPATADPYQLDVETLLWTLEEARQ